MWTKESRLGCNRDKLRYPSDLTDEEWALIAPLIPPARRGGRRRSVDLREVTNGIMYVLGTGCQWRAVPQDLPVPKDLPPRSTIFAYFDLWTYQGVLDRMHEALYVQCREHLEREPSPTACIIDSQSVKSAEKGGPGLTRMAMMRASRDNQVVTLRSKARSAISLSIRKAC